MANVKVYNDNVHPYKEQFRDQNIVIPAGGFIEMEEGDAHEFKCSYSPPSRGGDNQMDPKSFKMIRIEASSQKAAAPKTDESVCMKCSYKAISKKDLDEHIDANHLDDLADQELAEKRRSKK